MASERLQRQIDRLLDEAEKLIAQRDWASVQERARDVLAIDTDNQEGQAFLAAADRALGGPVSPSTAQPPDTSAAAGPATPSDQPSSFAGGRYQVQRFLGEGGKKKVYLAQDTTLDREVAFALIKAEGLDDTSRTRIQREAQAMGRLGSHPHIVTVFDLGEEPSASSGQGQPYMVTELMDGGDVEGLIEDAPNHLLPLEQAIKIAKETCRGLEFAHSRGIVHRDLKPGNVWLTADGTAKIGDFGLAVSLDRSRLTQEGMMVGTVSYMPPEQAMGGEVTPKSDLYSLGAMLYEMATGRPPFLGDDSVAIIGQHINTPPVAPTWHNGQCPRPLEALIMRLLAKDPSERPDSATDVLSALDAIDLSEGPPLERGDGGISDPHALDSLAGGVFVGRQREMGELKACLEDALSGRGRLVTLVGEPGIGKTRTALELATYAGLRQAQVLWGRCYEGEGAPPYWPWVQAIRSYVRDVDPEQLRSEMGAGAADIAEVVSDVREQLPGLEAPPQLEPEQARFKLFDSITAFLKNAAQRKPLVLVLDDLHWADHPSLLLLEFVARELGNARVLVIGTYRDIDLSRQHPLSQTLGELTRERLFQRVLLRGLDQEDVARFVELVSGVDPPSGMVEAVHRQTEGNPLFVTEIVRLLVQEGHLTAHGESVEPPGPSTSSGRAEGRDSWSVRIPEGVREVIGRRLDRLSERCNETLAVASVIGREFALEHLGPLIEDMTDDRLLEVLEEALSARVIEELPRTVGRYQFTHALIQETLADELSTTRKVRLHARIAETLETLYGAEAEAHVAELAHHFAEAQTVLGAEKLVHYSLIAGERALAAYAHEPALTQFQRGLAAKERQPADPETAALLFGLGRAQGATGQLDDAWATLGRAFDYYVNERDVAMAVAVAEYPLFYVSGLKEPTRFVSQALALVPPDSLEAGRLLSRLGLLLNLDAGDYEGATEAFGRALAIAQRENDEALEMRTLAAASDADFYRLRWSDVLEKNIRVVELARRANDPHSETWPHWLAAFSLLCLGRSEEAMAHATDMLRLAEKLNNRGLLSSAWVMNALAAHTKGEWQIARDFYDRELSQGSDSFGFLAYRSLLDHEVGDFGQGEAHLERCLEIMRQAQPGPTLEYAYSAVVVPLVARITGDSGRLDVAGEAGEAVVGSPSAMTFFASMARTGLGLLAVLRDDAAAAGEHYAILREYQGTMSRPGPTVVDRVLGLLAQTMGNLDQAMSHFEDSLAFCRKAGYRPELAWTCCDYADTLLQRNGEGDRAKAMSLLDESLAISSELGMRPLM
ncbi:MAG: protein kinase [Chloroflexi bacterium]|nr:protein kinase [Chloroflexota bacterium]